MSDQNRLNIVFQLASNTFNSCFINLFDFEDSIHKVIPINLGIQCCRLRFHFYSFEQLACKNLAEFPAESDCMPSQQSNS